ncbi:MAG TPA: DNA-processing protein DprA [Phycisphaerae bacterium]|nr:DNA-processing protein DprA [Phycisphaerae bacterium]HRR84788.1 DNA-processing protein DprA [Phycisphaerae bacterium]
MDPSEVASSAAIEHLRWSLTDQVGPITFGRLIERFGSAQAALGAGVRQLESIEGIGPATAEAIARSRDRADVACEVALAARHGVRIICRDDEEFPAPLRHIPDPPICLYVRGRLEPTDALAIAVVGSRRSTLYGREQAYRFGYQLAQRGMTIVSGLARGIDGESHKGALAAGGRTLAVLGNGLASVYPPEHRELADRVAADGALISELPMTTPPDTGNFLPRNRLIAGLSLGVLVVEAARRSGALSTAARASEYNREVFAVPGRVDSDYSVGTNALIRDQHAKLVTCADDILDELGEVGQTLRGTDEETEAEGEPNLFHVQPTLSGDEQAVCAKLDHEPRSVDQLAAAAGLPESRVASTLIMLQLKGLARQLPGNLFVRPGKR